MYWVKIFGVIIVTIFIVIWAFITWIGYVAFPYDVKGTISSFVILAGLIGFDLYLISRLSSTNNKKIGDKPKAQDEDIF